MMSCVHQHRSVVSDDRSIMKLLLLVITDAYIIYERPLSCNSETGACSTAHRSNRPDHCDGLMLDRSAVGHLSSLSSRTKWHFVLLDKDESCPAADRSNIGRPIRPVSC